MSTLRTNAWALVVLVGIVVGLLMLAHSAGARSVETSSIEASADSADARAEREAQARRVVEAERRRLAGLVTELEAARLADRAAAQPLVEAWDSTRNRIPTIAADSGAAAGALGLADSTITALRRALASLEARMAATDSLLAATDSINASLERELAHTRAANDALRRLQPTFWDAAREVAIEAACGGGGAAAGVIVAGEERQLAGALVGGVAAVVGCALATR